MWKNVPELDNLDITLFKKLGKGCYGVVYRAQSNSLVPVAAKTLHILLHPEIYNTEVGGQAYLSEANQLRQEVETMMKFSHPNIVQCFGVWFKIQGTRKIPHMICALGDCAFDVFLDEHKISQAKAIRFGIQIVKGIRYLHTQHSTTHKDIKPANMILFKQGNQTQGQSTSQYTVKLTDFGESECGIKHMKNLAGSPAYRDPKISTKDYDKSVDIYSFACVLVQMVCGYEALCKWNDNKQKGALPADIVSKLGAELSDLVLWCIQEDNRIELDDLLGILKAIT